MKSKKSLGLPRGTHRAKWGQNFLRDKRILKKIADFAQIEKEDTVVEVGSGEGTLTSFLLEKAKKVIAIEKDSDLALLLREKFNREIQDSKLEIIEGDILDLKLEKNSYSLSEQKIVERTSTAENTARTSERKCFLRANLKNYVLVGNIPYYITGALFKKALETEKPPKSITFVVQKEVAERIMGSHFVKTSRDKSRGKESILSISIKVYGTPEYGGIIKAGSFYPKPKVDSAIISIRDISKKHFINAVEQKFFEILKKGFAHKRKLLIKNLTEVSRFDLDTLKEIFDKCGISEKARAENLKVSDWLCLAKKFSPKIPKL